MFRPEDILKLVRQRPFRPLRIVTSSGEAFEVSHPELIMVGRHDLVVGRASWKDPGQYEEVDHIALLHVTAVETLRPSDAAPGDSKTAP